MNDKASELRAQLVRNFNEVELRLEQRAPLYETRCAALAVGTAASRLGISVDIVAPGKRGCPYHLHHAQEEMFIVLEGEGTLRVAGEMLPVKAGDLVFIPAGPDHPHQFINTSNAPMKYLSISTRDLPEICEYPDSGKFGAWAAGFDAMQRRASTLDYWDGEP